MRRPRLEADAACSCASACASFARSVDVSAPCSDSRPCAERSSTVRPMRSIAATGRRHLGLGLTFERRVARRELEVRGRDSERRAQLVHDLVEELTLLLAAGVEAVEHVVDSGREPAELVVTRPEVDPLRRLAAVDAVDDVRDLFHRSEHLPGDEPCEGCCGDERHCHRGQHPPQPVAPGTLGRGRRVLRRDLHDGQPIADLLDAGDGDRLGLVAQPSTEEEAEQRRPARRSRAPARSCRGRASSAACPAASSCPLVMPPHGAGSRARAASR